MQEIWHDGGVMKAVVYERKFNDEIAKVILNSNDMSFDIEYHGSIIEHHNNRVWNNIKDEKWALEMFVQFAVEDWESENYPDEEFLKALETMG